MLVLVFMDDEDLVVSVQLQWKAVLTAVLHVSRAQLHPHILRHTEERLFVRQVAMLEVEGEGGGVGDGISRFGVSSNTARVPAAPRCCSGVAGSSLVEQMPSWAGCRGGAWGSATVPWRRRKRWKGSSNRARPTVVPRRRARASRSSLLERMSPWARRHGGGCELAKVLRRRTGEHWERRGRTRRRRQPRRSFGRTPTRLVAGNFATASSVKRKLSRLRTSRQPGSEAIMRKEPYFYSFRSNTPPTGSRLVRSSFGWLLTVGSTICGCEPLRA
jgi:hypothetical protein